METPSARDSALLDPARRRTFEEAFVALLVRFGAREEGLHAQVSATLDESASALAEAEGGASLSRLDVLRIRAGKFAAARLPASVYREPAQLAALRREIQSMSAALLGPDAARGSRFASAQNGSPEASEHAMIDTDE